MISKEVDTSIVQESASEQSPLTRQIAPKNPMNVKPTIVKRIGALLLALHVQLLPIPQTTAQEATAHESTVIAKGATLTLLADGFKFTEGPTADARGNVYFTDQPNDTIHCWTIEGKLTTFLNPSGRSNGLFMASSGELLACADGNNELWSIDQAGAHIVILTAFEGKKDPDTASRPMLAIVSGS